MERPSETCASPPRTLDWLPLNGQIPNPYLTRTLPASAAPSPAKELFEYLNGKRTAFTIPIDWTLFTSFQREALQAVYRIPYGETRTYIDIAREINRPNAYRAVGAANAMNPMPLVIPCHRVIGTDGKLHGYGGGEGLPTKEWLLKMEGAVMA